MIHVATVHWHSARWIQPQQHYLERFLPGPFRAYAFLNRVPGDHRDKFFYISSEEVRNHATKLNLLGDLICFAADDPSDLLVFVDGDAFPVAPLGGLIEERLERHKLVAVQRYENNGDMQPHPCFCVTTVGFWQQIEGDWHRGHTWRDLRGQWVTDIGGNLLAALTRAGTDWYPMRRMNSFDAHPLLFGLYGDAKHGPLLYHHGGGFRNTPGGRVSEVAYRQRHAQTLLGRALHSLPRQGPLGRIRRRYYDRSRRRMKDEVRQLSEQFAAEIERDDNFWRRLA